MFIYAVIGRVGSKVCYEPKVMWLIKYIKNFLFILLVFHISNNCLMPKYTLDETQCSAYLENNGFHQSIDILIYDKDTVLANC